MLPSNEKLHMESTFLLTNGHSTVMLRKVIGKETLESQWYVHHYVESKVSLCDGTVYWEKIACSGTHSSQNILHNEVAVVSASL